MEKAPAIAMLRGRSFLGVESRLMNSVRDSSQGSECENVCDFLRNSGTILDIRASGE